MPTVTNTQGKINEGVALVLAAAASSVVNATEDFVMTLDGDHRTAILVKNGAGHGAVTIAIPVGDGFWFGKGDAGALTVADGTEQVLYLESAKYQANAGTITMTATPATGKRLLTDHALTVSVLEEPIAN